MDDQNDFFIKVGSLLPYLDIVAKQTNPDGTQSVYPLTGATGATFRMTKIGQTARKINDAAAVILDANAGKLRYGWASADTDPNSEGEYFGEFAVSFPGSVTPLIFPTGEHLRIRIGKRVP